MAVLKLTDKLFEDEVLQSEKPVIIDFYADWCGPCKMLSPVIEEISNENSDKIKVCKVNVDEERELAIKFGVSSIPTIVIFKDGKLANQLVGYHQKQDILAEI